MLVWNQQFPLFSLKGLAILFTSAILLLHFKLLLLFSMLWEFSLYREEWWTRMIINKVLSAFEFIFLNKMLLNYSSQILKMYCSMHTSRFTNPTDRKICKVLILLLYQVLIKIIHNLRS